MQEPQIKPRNRRAETRRLKENLEMKGHKSNLGEEEASPISNELGSALNAIWATVANHPQMVITSLSCYSFY